MKKLCILCRYSKPGFGLMKGRLLCKKLETQRCIHDGDIQRLVASHDCEHLNPCGDCEEWKFSPFAWWKTKLLRPWMP